MNQTVKPSLLFLTTSSNWPLTDGKRQRSWFLIEALSEKYNVDVLLIGFLSDKTQIEESSSSIRNFFFIQLDDLVLLQPAYPKFMFSKKQKSLNRSFRTRIEKMILDLDIENQYEFVLSRYLYPLFVFPLPNRVKLICDVDDVYFETQQSRIRSEANFVFKLKLLLLYFISIFKVRRIMQRINVPIVVKLSDQKYFKQNTIGYLPNLPFGFYLNEKENVVDHILDKNINSRFGFIGKLSYRPNYNGIISFINSVWNPLMQEGISAEFVIAGSGEIPKELEELIESSKNIKLLGFVEKSSEFWSQITTLVVPIAEGGGTNIKVAEAFMYNKNVVAHPFASRGYEAFLNQNFLFLPQNDKEWIEILKTISKGNMIVNNLDINKRAKEDFDLEKWNQSLLTIVEKNN